jgi:hypothetical protein
VNAPRRSPGPARRLRRLSAILRSLAESKEERLSVAMVAHAFGDHAFAAIMLVFGLLTIVSIAPGSTTVVGAPIVIVAWQLVVGRKVLWLPPRLSRRSIRPSDIGRLNARFLRHLRRAERLLAPRLHFLVGAFGSRLVGAVCLGLSIIIVMPIPLGNLLPGLSVVVLSMALLTRDGIAVLAGLAISVASVVVLIVVYGAVILALFKWL